LEQRLNRLRTTIVTLRETAGVSVGGSRKTPRTPTEPGTALLKITAFMESTSDPALTVKDISVPLDMSENTVYYTMRREANEPNGLIVRIGKSHWGLRSRQPSLIPSTEAEG